MTELMTQTITILDAALACFERVQIARSFEEDFASHQIKLDIIQLRLSRWGEAAGIYRTTKKDGEAKETTTLVVADQKTANDVLQEIFDLFDDAQRKAAKFQPQDTSVQVMDPASDLPSSMRTLRGKLRASLTRRSAQLANMTHSVKWALYKKEQFEKLVTNISELITKLEDLFPKEEATTRLEELGAIECADIGKTYLRTLKEITPQCDPYLDAAVEAALKPRETGQSGGVQFSVSGNNNGLQQGYVYGNQKGFNFGTMNKYGKGATNNYGK